MRYGDLAVKEGRFPYLAPKALNLSYVVCGTAAVIVCRRCTLSATGNVFSGNSDSYDLEA
jgi:hypothetical protein